MPRAGETRSKPPKDPFDRLLAIRRLARNNPSEHEGKAAEDKLAADLEKTGLTERDLDRIATMRGEGLRRRPKPVPRPVPQPQVRFVRQPQVQFFFYNSGFGGGYTGYDTGTSTGNGSFTSVTF